jgi:hypothetical protein
MRLNDVDEIEEFFLSRAQIESLATVYSEEELKLIIESVRWASHNPDYDFLTLFPVLPYSNAQIHEYLCRLDNCFREYTNGTRK